MFNCCSLYSGSSGNSFFITSGNTNILVDVGVSCKKILEALASINIDIHEIDAILITHEHTDHTKGLQTISSKYNIPVYATKKTWGAIKCDKLDITNKKIINIDTEFKIKDFNILPYSTPHDAVDPCGFKISAYGKSMCIATDLGHVSSTVYRHFSSSSMLMLESNYDPDILKISSYPYLLKQRIVGSDGHLSNITAGKVIAKLAKQNLKNALLIHLSQENNLPDLALTTIQEQLVQESADGYNVNISVAPRNCPSKFFQVV